jgi:transcriptional regulator with XRE-family HTH domain
MSAQRTTVDPVTEGSQEPDAYGVKARRVALGWSRRELAMRARVVEETVANLEQRDYKRRPSSLAAVKAALDRGEAVDAGGADGTVTVELHDDGTLIVRGPRPTDVAATVEELRRLREAARDGASSDGPAP